MYPSVCPLIVYSLIDSGTSAAADASVFSIESGTNKIHVLTNDVSKVGTYNIKAIGTVGSYQTAEVSFVITITNLCPTVAITTSTIAQ
jgi:hypothetical protein